MSPFNAQGKRQTAFAALQVVPMLHDGDVDVEVDESDIKMDVFRASGAGGQHINQPSSAVRLTHLPSGIIVSCQMDPSQPHNRAKPMVMPKPKLAENARLARLAALDAIRASQQRVGFGTPSRRPLTTTYQR